MFNPESPPEIVATRWFNADPAPTLEAMRGKVIVLGAFQMACPGSMRHLVPQLSRLAAQFTTDEVAVMGLHCVFEQVEKQTPDKLAAYIDEAGIAFPVAVDKETPGSLPVTMDSYELQGTPTLLVFDRQGRLRRHYLGQVDDMRLAAEVMALTIETRDAAREQSVALERRLAAVLVDPNEHHHDHDHDHDGCGCGHDHHHDHAHHHDHNHNHNHDHSHAHAGKQAKAEPKGGCGNPDCDCNG